MLFKPRLLDPDEVKQGDIIGFVGNGLISAGISLASWGIPWYSVSHIGIIGRWRGRNYLFESTALDDEPCAIRKQSFAGTKAKNLRDRIAAYHGKAWHYPLTRPLYNFEKKRLNDFLLSTLGLPYDTIGAFRAGGISWSWLESRLRDQDLHAIFCSEWCSAAHTNIGIFHTDNASRWSPHRFVLAERRLGILGKPRRLK
jgi:hypothetical protein